jgi:hypothetical protein
MRAANSISSSLSQAPFFHTLFLLVHSSAQIWPWVLSPSQDPHPGIIEGGAGDHRPRCSAALGVGVGDDPLSGLGQHCRAGPASMTGSWDKAGVCTQQGGDSAQVGAGQGNIAGEWYRADRVKRNKWIACGHGCLPSSHAPIASSKGAEWLLQHFQNARTPV